MINIVKSFSFLFQFYFQSVQGKEKTEDKWQTGKGLRVMSLQTLASYNLAKIHRDILTERESFVNIISEAKRWSLKFPNGFFFIIAMKNYYLFLA